MLWEILVPADFSMVHHDQWDNKILELIGGLTILREVHGKWLSPSETHDEKMIVVRVACKRSVLYKIIEFTKQHYNQSKIMAYKVSDDVIIE